MSLIIQWCSNFHLHYKVFDNISTQVSSHSNKNWSPDINFPYILYHVILQESSVTLYAFPLLYWCCLLWWEAWEFMWFFQWLCTETILPPPSHFFSCTQRETRFLGNFNDDAMKHIIIFWWAWKTYRRNCCQRTTIKKIVYFIGFI